MERGGGGAKGRQTHEGSGQRVSRSAEHGTGSGRPKNGCQMSESPPRPTFPLPFPGCEQPLMLAVEARHLAAAELLMTRGAHLEGLPLGLLQQLLVELWQAKQASAQRPTMQEWQQSW